MLNHRSLDNDYLNNNQSNHSRAAWILETKKNLKNELDFSFPQ